MPARILPGLALQAFFALGENGWNDEFDMNMLKLSVLVQGGVISRIGALPGVPVDGDIYIHTTDNKVNVRDDGAWVAFEPVEGWLLYDKDEDVYVSYDGAAWVELATSGGGGGGGGGTVDGTLYRFGGFFTGTPAADEVLLIHVASDAFTIPLNFGTVATFVGTNPTADMDFDIQVNGASIGTMTIATTGVVTFVVAATEIVSGDVIEIIAPAVADATLANVAFTFRCGVTGGGDPSLLVHGYWAANWHHTGDGDPLDPDTITVNEGGCWDAVAKTFTAPADGWYRFEAFGMGQGDGAYLMHVLVNGVDDYESTHSWIDSAGQRYGAIDRAILLVAGDTAVINFQRAGNPLYTGGKGGSYLTISRAFQRAISGGGGGSGKPWYWNPPAMADFAADGFGDTTQWADDADVGLIVQSTNSMSIVNVRGQACPAGADWTCTMHFEGAMDSSNYANMGIAIYNAAHSKFFLWAMDSRSSTHFFRYNAAGFDGFEVLHPMASGYDWLRVHYDHLTGHLSTFYSGNGKVWSQLDDRDVATDLGSAPAFVGPCTNTESGHVQTVGMAVDFWEVV